MYETTRHQYLSAMGIDSYMPRCVLPNAPQSIECEWPPLAGDTQATTAIQSSAMPESTNSVLGPEGSVATSPAPAQAEALGNDGRMGAAVGAAELLAGFEPEGQRKKSAPNKAKEAKVDTAIEQPAQSLRFSLSVWRLDDLLVVDSRHSEKALPTEKLLLSMLQAYGFKLGNLPKAQVLQWPMFDMPAAESGPEAAREMLGAFLETLLETPVNYWWLMGGDAFTYCRRRCCQNRMQPMGSLSPGSHYNHLPFAPQNSCSRCRA